MLLEDKIKKAILLIQKAESLALQYSEDGFYLAFSGGKDSMVIHELTKMAGVRYKAHMQMTSLDPPILIRFIRTNYPNVILHRPPINFYKLMIKKRMLPLMNARYCCQYLKEFAGANTVTILGIRKQESVRRAKRNELEMDHHKYSNTLDQFNLDLENKVVCVGGKDKILLSPIVDWTESEVWKFIRLYKLPYCDLYKQKYERIGCIFCPMSSVKSKLRDRQNFPKFEFLIKRSIQFLIDNFNYGNQLGGNVDDVFNWWISNDSVKTYLNRKKRNKFF